MRVKTIGVGIANVYIVMFIPIFDKFFEVTQIGRECYKKCTIYEQIGGCVIPRKGIFARP